jgi:beta-1,2-mannobiose phosphorylase / 1,2-beta-oligomannan phosphorylase
MAGFQLKRLGLLMEPEAGNPLEVEGVLNPAGVRGPDGQFYLFPRLVARGNYSRIGIARVKFNEAGDPAGVERLGIALEPEADYERRPDGGGREDPRITFVERFQRYVMTYTAISPIGPRIALAVSEDLFHWRRLGLATFAPYRGIDFVNVDNKDASLFPVAIPNHAGKMQMAILHRPLFPGTRPEETACQTGSRVVDLDHESIWISYCPMVLEDREPHHLGLFNSHHRLATPVSPWEILKIGGGTPPVLTRHGWLIIYHGVCELPEPGHGGHHLCYSAGVMLLSKEHPRVLRYRSAEPVLTPVLAQERQGTIANVVFPTAIDRRDDLGLHDRFDVYYGMADNRIGVASLDVPEFLPPGALADAPPAKRSLQIDGQSQSVIRQGAPITIGGGSLPT